MDAMRQSPIWLLYRIHFAASGEAMELVGRLSALSVHQALQAAREIMSDSGQWIIVQLPDLQLTFKDIGGGIDH